MLCRFIGMCFVVLRNELRLTFLTSAKRDFVQYRSSISAPQPFTFVRESKYLAKHNPTGLVAVLNVLLKRSLKYVSVLSTTCVAIERW